MLPMYKQADQYRKDASDKDDEIKGLNLELAAVKASLANGVGTRGDVGYWKDRYESLLATLGG